MEYYNYKYKITIEYLGTNFHGWQKQKNNISVQEVLESVIFKYTSEKVEVYGAGRTDAGVHAYAQTAHFVLCKLYDCLKLKLALNYFIGSYDITILDCVLVDEGFHARFSAKKRHYLYKILNRSSKTVIEKGLKYWVRKPLSVENMQKASLSLLGTHDFSAFRSSECQANSSIKTLDSISIRKIYEYEIHIFVSARSFLQKMVRNIVGSLLMVGQNKRNSDYIGNLILSKDRTQGGPTAPAHGLYLIKIDY